MTGPTPSLAVREHLLHGLGHDMGGGVAHDGEAVFGIEGDGFDVVAVVSGVYRSRGSPLRRTAMMFLSSAKSSTPVVVASTSFASPLTVMEMELAP